MKRKNGITSHTARLLSEGESDRVDFKRTPEGVNADDLVAFANSAAGGCILVGIEERPGRGGAQIGVVVGCDVGDAPILQIVNKALACFPPVAITATVENLTKTPFLRIDVPSSATKPHCTPKGIYCRRDGSRNRPLHPSELLSLFVESEARVFAERFESAANRIVDDLGKLERNLDSSIKSMTDQLGWADSKLDDTESRLGSILAYTKYMSVEIDDLTKRVRALFRQDQRQDPIYDRERKALLDRMVEQFMEDEELRKGLERGGSFSLETKGKAAQELTEDDLRQVFHEAIKIVGERLVLEKYSIHLKKPAQCEEGEIQELAKLIAEGGEVVNGIEQRLKTADRLGLVHYDKELVGSAALKQPVANYRKSVFEKAKASVDPSDYSRELGWVYLKEKHRSKGQMKPLIENLLKAAGSNGVFATTRKSNDKMQRILAHQGFVLHGQSYESVQNEGDEIVLFIRPGTKRV
jgi:hypothetical protein